MKTLFITLTLITLLSFTSQHLLFTVVPNQSRCFIDELFDDTVMMIKWKIFTKSKEDVTPALPNMVIFVTSEETKEEVLMTVPNSPKSKTTFTPPKGGFYRFCVIYRTRYSDVKDTLYMNMRFGSDNMDHPDIGKAIQSQDVVKLESKANDIIQTAKPIIDRYKTSLEQENENANVTIQTTRWYKYLTFAQIILCIVIGLVQANNFRRFLKSQNII